MLVMLAVCLRPGSVLLICHWRSVVLVVWIDFERKSCFFSLGCCLFVFGK